MLPPPLPESRRGSSVHGAGRLKVRGNSAHGHVHAVVGEDTSLCRYVYTENRDEHRSRVSIRQDLPTTCRHPPAPQDLPSHPTQREEEVKGGVGGGGGGGGRERKQDIDVKHAAHNHTDEMKRTIERDIAAQLR